MTSALTSYPRAKEIVRVDLAPATQAGKTLMHPTMNSFAPPLHKNLKTIAHSNVKPHVMPIRNDFARRSHQNPIVLPKLIKPGGRNRSMANRSAQLNLSTSAIASNGPKYASSVRHRQADIIADAK